jgi:uncharacterized NAD-dependent epimerase/dehydratase family protein
LDGTAVVATNGQLGALYGKTAHGLIRGTSRYRLLGVIDAPCAGRDAGEVVDGAPRGIPVFASLDDALKRLPEKPDYYILGYAAPGGRLQDRFIADIEQAIRCGLSVVNGMHQFLSDEPHFADLAARHGAKLVDVRKLSGNGRYWTGEILSLAIPRLAVLGMDCAIGKRTTVRMLAEACNRNGIKAEWIATGQTGWMQGARYGFILDSVLNDYVCGELEHAILTAAKGSRPGSHHSRGSGGAPAPFGDPAGPSSSCRRGRGP